MYANRFTLRLFVLTLGLLTAGTTRGADFAITEFMAVNRDVLEDEDGDYSDWVEVYNTTDSVKSLAGWHLTDDPMRLDKWAFPEVELGPGEFLLVFASSKNRQDPSTELHTNFRLEKDGEFLALVEPDAATVASEFTEFPKQVPYASYGFSMGTTTSFFGLGTEAAYHVPTSDVLGDQWVAPEFGDGEWPRGPLPIGYDRKSRPSFTPFIATDIQELMDRVSSSAYVRIAFDLPADASFDSLLLTARFEDAMAVYLNGEEILRENTEEGPLTWESQADRSRTDAVALTPVQYDLAPHAAKLVAGTNIVAIHGINRSASNSDFFLEPALEGITFEGVAERGSYFTSPSPGWLNGTGVAAIAPEPTFSRASGAFVGSFELVLETDAEGGEIRYTTDGSDPIANSTLYSGPITIEDAGEVRARVYLADHLPSPIVSSSYLELHEAVAENSSNLPILIVDTFRGGIQDGALTPGHALMIDLDAESGRAKLTDAASLSHFIGIKKRGSSSLGFPKNNYAMELWDENREDTDESVLGMAPESDWILHGPYSDKSLMRNQLTYEWSNQIGQWAVKTRFIELYLNVNGGEVAANDYHGVYVFMEKIKRGEDRLDIASQDERASTEPEITGGYIFKNDRPDPGDQGFRTSRLTLRWVYPKEREVTAAQRAYVNSYFRDFEAALYGPDFADPEVGYRKYIDTTSFIDQHLLVELCKNIDGYRLSTFMFKDREGKLKMGPAWDYNLSLRNANYNNGSTPTGWYWSIYENSIQEYPWYARLFDDPAFSQEYAARWLELRGEHWTNDYLIGTVDRNTELLQESSVRNFQRWRILGSYVWPNPNPLARTFNQEVDLMKEWLVARLRWMDSQLVPPPLLSHPGGVVEPGFELTITSPGGDIYYTLDGTDPRGSNREPSESAILYTGALTINENTVVRARVKLGDLWSGRMAEGGYLTEFPTVVVSEFMYHPAPPDEGSPYSKSDFEFIEVQNVGSEAISLAGLKFGVRPVTFEFPDVELPAGGFGVIARNPDAFRSRYGDGATILGEFERGSLSDSGEPFELEFTGVFIAEFTYDDEWYPETDGGGYSLSLKNPLAALGQDLNDRELWKASSVEHGTPGLPDSGEEPAGLQRPNDFNQDGKLNVTDAISLLGRLFGSSTAPLPCSGASIDSGGNLAVFDANGDGGVNLSDAVYSLQYMFGRGAPHALGRDCVRVGGCPDVCTE